MKFKFQTKDFYDFTILKQLLEKLSLFRFWRKFVQRVSFTRETFSEPQTRMVCVLGKQKSRCFQTY